ncbi:AAA family ATPase [Streptomyces syringium]|uniref:AAA family ATPase n=1 Tax=Streptomyces syringium TaxID=76729 RepID=UPI003447B850
MTDTPSPSCTTQPTAPFITRVQVENYKSISHCDVRLGPFAVLLGLNAAGKSNFLDALRFLRDAVTGGPGEAVMTRGGLTDVLRRVPEPTDTLTIALEFQLPAPVHLSGDAQWEGRYEITLGRPRALGKAGWGGIRVVHEACELGPAGAPPEAAFQVKDGVAVDPAGGKGLGRLRPGNLYLPLVSVSEPYARLHEALTSMFFYDPDLAALRDARPATGADTLDEDGGHLGAVLGLVGTWEQDRVSAYAGAVVPHLTEVGPTAPTGDYVAARMTMATGQGGAPQEFRAESMSEGTIRTIGLLTALFQPRARDGRISMVAVEEPELALHPMAAGVLFDALTEASASVQVLATSQSAELLDRKEADLSAILVVTADDGVTTIGPVDAVSRSIVSDGLATMGELLRSDQLRSATPDSAPGGPAS